MISDVISLSLPDSGPAVPGSHLAGWVCAAPRGYGRELSDSNLKFEAIGGTPDGTNPVWLVRGISDGMVFFQPIGIPESSSGVSTEFGGGRTDLVPETAVPAGRDDRMLTSFTGRLVLVLVLVGLVGGVVLWLWSWPPKPEADGLEFSNVPDRIEPAEREPYEGDGGTTLHYRAYPAPGAETVVVALHGSGSESRYLAPLGRFLSRRGAAHVVTPDLRGHGPDPVRRGDVEDPDQLVRDLAALFRHVEGRWDPDRIVLLGHSSGGGLATRLAGSEVDGRVDGYVLLAPFLGPFAPSTREQSGGWAQANVGRIVIIQMLQGLGIEVLGGTEVLRFQLPEARRDGYETGAYSYRMMKALEPREWERDLSAADSPVLILAGDRDEAMNSPAYSGEIGPAVEADVEILEDVGHLDVVHDERVLERIITFLSELD